MPSGEPYLSPTMVDACAGFAGSPASAKMSERKVGSVRSRWYRQVTTVARLADEVASLPLAIHVDSDVSFDVTHADLHPLGSKQASLFNEETICVHKADIVTASRVNFSAALKSELLGLRFGRHSVQVSAASLGPLPMPYVGHSPLRDVTVHNSYVVHRPGQR